MFVHLMISILLLVVTSSRALDVCHKPRIESIAADHTCPERAFEDNISMQYSPNSIPFDISISTLEALGLPPDNFATRKDFMKNFVFATAFNARYFEMGLCAIHFVQKQYPDRKIIVYDLGMNETQLSFFKRSKENKSLCNVEYRYFNFSLYPPHVAKLKAYAWKLLVIQSVLRHHPGLVWMDSSSRFEKTTLHNYLRKLTATNGVLLVSETTHSNFAVTHNGLYSYIPTNTEKQKSLTQWEACVIILYNTRPVYHNFLHWAYLCVLTESCIAPTYQTNCHFIDGDRFKTYCGCHRFDQATINILLSNWFDYDKHQYTQRPYGFKNFRRPCEFEFEPKYCDL